MLWGKSIEDRDEMNKISAGKPGLELQLDNREAAAQQPQVPGDEGDDSKV